jgi:hypothetical protein
MIMRRKHSVLRVVLCGLLLCAAVAAATAGGAADDTATIAGATAAAPSAVGKDAAVVVIEADGSFKTVRAGKNNFTCVPDNPASPGVDPMCVDGNGLLWLKAWVAHKSPPAGKVGFGYMLKGGSDASNTDPFASKPKEGEHWVETGPHVMIFNGGDMVDGYPRHVMSKHDTAVPYVMWAGTPYAHLMIPVQ